MPLIQKDSMLYLHVILGLAVMLLAVYVLTQLRVRSSVLLKVAAIGAALVSWLQLLPSAATYLIFYPATKSLVKAGAWPWAHSIVMETKEHWGLLLPVVATVAAGLVFQGRTKESRKWWWLVIILTILMGVMGRVVKMGALAR